MGAVPRSSVEELQAFFDEMSSGIQDQVEVLAPYMVPRSDESAEQVGSAGTMEHLVIEIDEINQNHSGHSTKLSNVVLQVKRAIGDADTAKDVAGTLFNGVEGIQNLDHPVKMAFHILLLLNGVRKLSKVTVGVNEALLLRELALLDFEENSVRKTDLESRLSGRLSAVQLADALVNLETLGSVILSLDEIILNETIEIRVRRQRN